MPGRLAAAAVVVGRRLTTSSPDSPTDTVNFIHNTEQGPYYTGPWYVNRAGRRIDGVYFDVDVADATENPGGAEANDISYAAGFNSGTALPRRTPTLLYAGCFDWWGFSASSVVNPYAPLR